MNIFSYLSLNIWYWAFVWIFRFSDFSDVYSDRLAHELWFTVVTLVTNSSKAFINVKFTVR